jgi:trans-aconitate methyltransferase
MSKKLKNLLAAKGVLYLLTRFGGSALRRCSFDQYYKSGCWDYFETEHSMEMVEVVEKYANKGRVLDIGCGPGILASLLNSDSFEYYCGVDASPEAIARAQKRKNEKIDFEIGDIQNYKCRDKFDLIVFEESLYYVPFFRRQLLKRYAQQLQPGGVFVVTVAHPNRFRGMIKMIHKNFQIIEERFFSNSHRLLLVFC